MLEIRQALSGWEVAKKEGRCWWLSPHRWSQWITDDPTELHGRQYRRCFKCGKYEQFWIPRRVEL